EQKEAYASEYRDCGRHTCSRDNDDQVICYSAAAARRQLKWWQCSILVRALLLFPSKLRTRSSQFLLFCRVDRWVGEIEFLHRLYDGCSDDEASKPFVVSRHHVPRGAF